MKLANANSIRKEYVEFLLEKFSDEDVGMIASNSFNFPIVAEDGEEGWVEIVVKVSKEGGDDGYLKREEYTIKERLKAEKKALAAKKKAEKIAADKERRAAKALERQKLKEKG